MSTAQTEATSKMNAAVDVAREHAVHTTKVSKEAVLSRSYLYPPLGAFYLLYHPSLWPPVLTRLLPCLALSAGVIIPMFLFTYIPQAAVLTFLNGPVGPFSAAALVLSESATIINVLARSFLLEGALTDLFDATLVCEDQQGLVMNGRELKPGGKTDGAKKLGRMLMKPTQKFSPKHLIEYAMFLPLNLIPIFGTAIFLIVQGRKTGPGWHSRYFQLKGFNGAEKDAFIARHRGGYIAFGTISTVMNLIPLASILFTFTSTVGAALWAAEIEKEARYPGEKVNITGTEGHNGHVKNDREL